MRWPLAPLLLLSGCVTAPPGPALTAHTGHAFTTRKAPGALELALTRWRPEGPWRLSELRGKVVLLDVWATWCEPCREGLPLYQDLKKEFGARGLEVFAVNIDADPRGIEAFLEAAKVADLPVLLDPEGQVTLPALKVKLMPTAFLLDRRGVVRHVHEGFDEGALAQWLEEIEALLAEPAR